MVGMENATATHDERLRDLEADIDALADAVGTPGERPITQRLDTIERVLFALARTQGVDPDAI
ncbi:hypothetical protein [Streptomyces jeddahensis]|uniref:Uncharacterized protein n=1 Tax=Streptomyces jeddahensis TaxID=1716141 RepID=A0A177HZT3_9ACTN|nr:hypothetical protein [Streptomyces jeddahensis]OAH16325.1 hypothetical protein STSP_02880 [Streptomyces jeddahensis]